MAHVSQKLVFATVVFPEGFFDPASAPLCQRSTVKQSESPVVQTEGAAGPKTIDILRLTSQSVRLA